MSTCRAQLCKHL